ncbi:alpha/beta hydrolase [Streptomyces sp. NPDC051677]|uniref:alpha/beta hydrolase n=1 Tax=Streptomyces sp. NPDC051677 TaxID=3365669 RepID=UPI0037D98609
MKATTLPGALGEPALELLHAAPTGPVAPGSARLLFVHGLGYAAWCWEDWMSAAAAAGHDSWAISLRGHGGSGGTAARAVLSDYEADVVRAARSIPGPVVLIGHSMGGLVVQRAAVAAGAAAMILVAPLPPRPAVHTVLSVLRRQPWEVPRYLAGRPLRLGPHMLHAKPDAPGTAELGKRLTPDSPLVQYQFLFHLPTRVPPLPALVLAAAEDRLVPFVSVRATAKRYEADIREIEGVGHSMMLDAQWPEGWKQIESWLADNREAAAGRSGPPPAVGGREMRGQE